MNDVLIANDTRVYRRLMPSADVVPNTFLPYVILKERAINFESIRNTIYQFDDTQFKDHPYYIHIKDNKPYSVYPMGTGIFALPFYVVPVFLQKIPELTYHENILKIFILGRISASFYAALSVSLMYLILKKISKNDKLILFFTMFYAFGTGTFTVSSRGLWQHTISQFLITILIYSLLLLKKNTRHIFLSFLGFIVGLVFFVRPTNAVIVLFITIYLAILYRSNIKSFAYYLIGSLPIAVIYFLTNKYLYGGFFTEGYGARNDFNWSTSLSTSLPEYFFSPGRGILFLTPVLMFGFVFIYNLFFSKKFKHENILLYRFLAFSYFGVMLLFAKWYTWDGAPAFGNRMLVDILPIISLFSFEYIKNFKKLHFVFVIVLMVFSIFIHFNAAYYRKNRCSRDHTWSFYCLLVPKKELFY